MPDSDIECPACGASLASDTCPSALRRMTTQELEARVDEFCNESVLGKCPHGVDLDREFCPQGCRV